MANDRHDIYHIAAGGCPRGTTPPQVQQALGGLPKLRCPVVAMPGRRQRWRVAALRNMSQGIPLAQCYAISLYILSPQHCRRKKACIDDALVIDIPADRHDAGQTANRGTEER